MMKGHFMLTATALLMCAFAQGPAQVKPLTYEHLGKKLTPFQIRTSAKRFDAKVLANPTEKAVGKLVRAEGVWQQTEEGAVSIGMVSNSKRPYVAPLDVSRFKDVKMRSGLNVTIYGVLRENGIEVLFYDLAPPGLQWAIQLQQPGAIIAGQDQTFYVDLVLKNTGRQPLLKVVGACRLWQLNSPNDWTEEIEFVNLLPGETRTLTVPFKIFNYQYIGQTSLPQCAFAVTYFE